MDKITEVLNKYVMYAIYGVFFLVFINTCSTRSRNKENYKMRSEIDTLAIQLNTLKHSIYIKEELDSRMKIQGYELSKNILYDWNAVVRTKIRPDDRTKEYDVLIAKERAILEKITE